MYMSSSENYATFTAKALDADYRIISQGGWGVYCGWDNDVRHNIPFLNLPNITADTVGAHMHPGVKSHERAARVLIEYLQEIFF